MQRIIAVLLLLQAPVAGAEVYKWVDEAGNVHYGDRPDKAAGASEIQVDAPSLKTDIGELREEKRERLLEAMEEDRQELDRQRKQQQAERARRAKQCKRLKNTYDRYRYASGVYRKDKEGNRSYFSNEQRAKKEAQLRKRMKEVCS